MSYSISLAQHTPLDSTHSFQTSSQLKMAPKPQQAAPPTTASPNALNSLLKAYNETTSSRLKTIDAFLIFLMLSGIVQFLYCVLVTNFPFNAFLAGYARRFPICCGQVLTTLAYYSFSSCVGQFVLTASLRSQVNPANRGEFKEVSPER